MVLKRCNTYKILNLRINKLEHLINKSREGGLNQNQQFEQDNPLKWACNYFEIDPIDEIEIENLVLEIVDLVVHEKDDSDQEIEQNKEIEQNQEIEQKQNYRVNSDNEVINPEFDSDIEEEAGPSNRVPFNPFVNREIRGRLIEAPQVRINNWWDNFDTDSESDSDQGPLLNYIPRGGPVNFSRFRRAPPGHSRTTNCCCFFCTL